MADEFNWEYNAPGFVDFSVDVDSQAPSNSYFMIDHEKSDIPKDKGLDSPPAESLRTSTPDPSHSHRAKRKSSLKPLRIPRQSVVKCELDLEEVDERPITPNVSLIKNEPSIFQPNLEQRTSTPDTPRTSTSCGRLTVTPVTVKKQVMKRRVSERTNDNPPKRRKMGITVPKTPIFMTQSRIRKAHQRREVREREEQAHKRIEQRKRTNNRAQEQRHTTASASTSRSSLADLAKPKTHTMQTRREATIDDFVKSLRSGSAPSKRVLASTIPVTPNLMYRKSRRGEQLPSSEELEMIETKKKFRASAVGHIGIPFFPKLNNSKFTVAQPFTVHETSRAMLAKKQAKIRNIVEQERKGHEFVANPMPCEPDALPQRQIIEPTQTVPFQLQTDKRGKQWQARWQDQMKQESQMNSDSKLFRANRILRSNFIPQPSTRPPTEFDEFNFSTDNRSTERHELLNARARQNQENMHIISAQDEDKRREDARSLAEERAQRVIKAKPIGRFKAVKIAKSDRPVTQPQTPKFSERFKK